MHSLKNKECTVAIITGVNAMLTPTVLNAYGLAKMTSPTGRGHTFDASEDGYLRGEGCSTIVLKALDQNVDESKEKLYGAAKIHAILSAALVVHDGSSVSFTAPILGA